MAIGIVALEDFQLEQLNVNPTLLHDDFNEDIYMEQPHCFQIVGKENIMCKFKKSMYRLKQAPKQW